MANTLVITIAEGSTNVDTNSSYQTKNEIVGPQVCDKCGALEGQSQINTELLEALERTEQTMRNLASNLTGDLRTIARNETFNIKETLSKAKGE